MQFRLHSFIQTITDPSFKNSALLQAAQNWTTTKDEIQDITVQRHEGGSFQTETIPIRSIGISVWKDPEHISKE